jgi:hypothetical protein
VILNNVQNLSPKKMKSKPLTFKIPIGLEFESKKNTSGKLVEEISRKVVSLLLKTSILKDNLFELNLHFLE